VSAFQPESSGYFGKLPAKGDFLRAGLPEDFVTAWDAWCRDFLNVTRAALADDWEPAWMEAPIWHFLLPAGACGTKAALGVWVASVDKVGRHFPFTAVALAASSIDLESGGFWLGMAEEIALSGVVDDAPHEDFAARLAAPAAQASLAGPGWWTQGSPLVAPQRLEISGLPGPDFAPLMLRDLTPTGAQN
jgi:type VI secretion system protein ImpM